MSRLLVGSCLCLLLSSMIGLGSEARGQIPRPPEEKTRLIHEIALASFEAAQRIPEPQLRFTTLCSLSGILIDRKELELARAAAEAALPLSAEPGDSLHAGAVSDLIAALVAVNDSKSALALIHKMPADPWKLVAYRRFGEAAAAKGDLAQARSAIAAIQSESAAVKRDPQTPPGLTAVSNIQEIERAIAAYQRLQSSPPSPPPATAAPRPANGGSALTAQPLQTLRARLKDSFQEALNAPANPRMLVSIARKQIAFGALSDVLSEADSLSPEVRAHVLLDGARAEAGHGDAQALRELLPAAMKAAQGAPETSERDLVSLGKTLGRQGFENEGRAVLAVLEGLPSGAAGRPRVGRREGIKQVREALDSPEAAARRAGRLERERARAVRLAESSGSGAEQLQTLRARLKESYQEELKLPANALNLVSAAKKQIWFGAISDVLSETDSMNPWAREQVLLWGAREEAARGDAQALRELLPAAMKAAQDAPDTSERDLVSLGETLGQKGFKSEGRTVLAVLEGLPSGAAGWQRADRLAGIKKVREALGDPEGAAQSDRKLDEENAKSETDPSYALGVRKEARLDEAVRLVRLAMTQSGETARATLEKAALLAGGDAQTMEALMFSAMGSGAASEASAKLDSLVKRRDWEGALAAAKSRPGMMRDAALNSLARDEAAAGETRLALETARLIADPYQRYGALTFILPR